jgi:ribosomal protein S18 acetylase RimI-like enzyme
VVEYRTFRNTDPPLLVQIWNESLTGRGAARLRHSTVLERHVLSKPYFEAAGLLIAEENGVALGFSHVGFGPNQRETQLARSIGVVCLVAVRPAFRRRGIGSELLRRAEAHLRERGAQTIEFGAAKPVNPFYFGIYGGSDQPGLLDTEGAAGFLERRGYKGWENTIVYQRVLDQPVNIADGRFAALRRKYDVRILPRIPLGTWWQECAVGLVEPVEFRLEDKTTGKAIARANAWEMEAFSSTWNQPAVGLLDISVRDDLRRQGLAKFLLAQMLRYLQDQYFGVVEVQAAESDKTAAALFASVGFEKVDVGRAYRKT